MTHTMIKDCPACMGLGLGTRLYYNISLHDNVYNFVNVVEVELRTTTVACVPFIFFLVIRGHNIINICNTSRKRYIQM